MLAFVLMGQSCKKSEDVKKEVQQKEDKQSDQVQRYKQKQGTIEYKISGQQTGTETLYFSDYGNKEAKYTNTTLRLSGISVDTNQMTLLDGADIITVNFDTNTGTRIKNPIYDDLQEAAKQSNSDLTDIGKEMLKNSGGVYVGTDTVAGQECEVWEVKDLNTTTCVWDGIALRTESDIAGVKLLYEAISVSSDVDESKFELPDGVNIVDGPNLDDLKGFGEGILEMTK